LTPNAERRTLTTNESAGQRMAKLTPERADRVARIAKEWQAGISCEQLATRYGISEDRVRNDLSVARKRGLLPPYTRPAPQMTQVAEMYRNGMTPPQIAEKRGVSLGSVQRQLALARDAGLAPAHGNRDKGGMATWRYHTGKGSAPPLGTMGAFVEHLTAAQIERMLDLHTQADKTLADTVARIVKEHLNGDQTTR